MPKKYNDNSPEYKDWTTKKLKEEAKNYHNSIYGGYSCYGSTELLMFDGILQELDNRGIQPFTKLTF